jgi:hypothetical protein
MLWTHAFLLEHEKLIILLGFIYVISNLVGLFTSNVAVFFLK